MDGIDPATSNQGGARKHEQISARATGTPSAATSATAATATATATSRGRQADELKAVHQPSSAFSADVPRLESGYASSRSSSRSSASVSRHPSFVLRRQNASYQLPLPVAPVERTPSGSAMRTVLEVEEQQQYHRDDDDDDDDDDADADADRSAELLHDLFVSAIGSPLDPPMPGSGPVHHQSEEEQGEEEEKEEEDNSNETSDEDEDEDDQDNNNDDDNGNNDDSNDHDNSDGNNNNGSGHGHGGNDDGASTCDFQSPTEGSHQSVNSSPTPPPCDFNDLYGDLPMPGPYSPPPAPDGRQNKDEQVFFPSSDDEDAAPVSPPRSIPSHCPSPGENAQEQNKGGVGDSFSKGRPSARRGSAYGGSSPPVEPWLPGPPVLVLLDTDEIERQRRQQQQQQQQGAGAAHTPQRASIGVSARDDMFTAAPRVVHPAPQDVDGRGCQDSAHPARLQAGLEPLPDLEVLMRQLWNPLSRDDQRATGSSAPQSSPQAARRPRRIPVQRRSSYPRDVFVRGRRARVKRLHATSGDGLPCGAAGRSSAHPASATGRGGRTGDSGGGPRRGQTIGSMTPQERAQFLQRFHETLSHRLLKAAIDSFAQRLNTGRSAPSTPPVSWPCPPPAPLSGLLPARPRQIPNVPSGPSVLRVIQPRQGRQQPQVPAVVPQSYPHQPDEEGVCRCPVCTAEDVRLIQQLQQMPEHRDYRFIYGLYLRRRTPMLARLVSRRPAPYSTRVRPTSPAPNAPPNPLPLEPVRLAEVSDRLRTVRTDANGRAVLTPPRNVVIETSRLDTDEWPY